MPQNADYITLDDNDNDYDVNDYITRPTTDSTYLKSFT